MQNLVDELKYNLVCEYGKDINNKKSEDLYLSITILDNKNKIVEIFDEGFLTASTLLVWGIKSIDINFFLGKMMNLLKI